MYGKPLSPYPWFEKTIAPQCPMVSPRVNGHLLAFCSRGNPAALGAVAMTSLFDRSLRHNAQLLLTALARKDPQVHHGGYPKTIGKTA